MGGGAFRLYGWLTMAVHRFFNNWTAGELSPLLDGRADLQQYDRGGRVLENVRVMPYGGVRIRSGTVHVAAVKTAGKKVRLVPFNFSTGTAFVLEFGDQYLRFYSNQVQVLSGGSPYEVATPYLEADLFRLQFKQINDVVYIAHPSYGPRKLSRVTDTNWTLDVISPNVPPLREENTGTTTLTMSHTTGTGRTLTASASTFTANHVGAFFELRHRREADAVELDISTTSGSSSSSALTVKGDWQVVTTERWYGTLEVERSLDGGSTWSTVRKFKSSADRNVSASGSESEECQLRLTYKATGDPYGSGVWVGTAPTNYVKAKAKLESTEAFVNGLVKVTAYTSATSVTVDVVETVASTAATDIWSEAAWSAHRGFPRTVGLFEQRVMWGGNAERPTRVWGSKTGDFENFEYSTDDDGGVAFDIAATESNAIQWLASLDSLLVGTGGSEHKLDSGDESEPLTPSNVKVKGQSVVGSEPVQPVQVDKAVLYVQRQGKKVREMIQDGGRYVSNDVTLLSEHVTRNGVTQLGYAAMPDPLLLAVTPDALGVMTYDRDQGVLAWTRWVTDGVIESACAIYGSSGDEIWLAVRRTVGGSTVRYVERVTVETENKATATLLDCHKTGTLTGPFSGTISGLSHLEGRTVRLVVAGAVIGDFLVSSGAITVPVGDVPTLGFYVVGLPYTAKVQPMKLDLVMSNGATQGKVRRITELTLRFRNTLGAKFGPSLSKLETVTFRNANDVMDASAPLFTGDKSVPFNSGHDRTGDLFVVQDQPLPFTLLGVLARADFFGE